MTSEIIQKDYLKVVIDY